MNLRWIAITAAALALTASDVAAKGLYDPGKITAPRPVQPPANNPPAAAPPGPAKDATATPAPTPAVTPPPVAVTPPPVKDFAGPVVEDAAGTGFWQGSWGIASVTPVVTVAATAVSYQGANGQSFAVSGIAITTGQIQFQVGTATVSLTRRSDNNADMVSTIGANSSRPILLCKSPAAHCP
jgi:hypothetical protein